MPTLSTDGLYPVDNWPDAVWSQLMDEIQILCIWHGVEMAEKIDPTNGKPYWECPECIKQFECQPLPALEAATDEQR